MITIAVTIDGVGSLFAVEIDDFAIDVGSAVVRNSGPAVPVGHEVAPSWTGRGRVRGDKRPMPVQLISAIGIMSVGHAPALNHYGFAAGFRDIQLAHAPTDSEGEEVWEVAFTVAKLGPLTSMPARKNYDSDAEWEHSIMNSFFRGDNYGSANRTQ